MHGLLFPGLWLALAAGLFAGKPVFAAVEISRGGAAPVLIQDVYQRDGEPFVAIDEVLGLYGLSGQWDNVAHLYRIDMPGGAAVISPGSRYLRVAGRSMKVSHRPRFINGKLRVSATFVSEQLAPALGLSLQLRDLDPVAPPPPQSPLDEFFSLLLQQQPKSAADNQWVVAIDAGHGGQDAGAIGNDGTTERTVNLAVAEQLHKLLKMRRDAPVVMTRDADYALGAVQRVEAVTRGRADVLLSLHAQAGFSPAAEGITLFVAPEAVDAGTVAAGTQSGARRINASRRLAEILRDTLVAAGYRVAPVEERTLLPLGQGDLPRVLVEMGYLSNEGDLLRLRDPAAQALLARTLYDGLETFLNSYQDLQESNDVSTPPSAQQ